MPVTIATATKTMFGMSTAIVRRTGATVSASSVASYTSSLPMNPKNGSSPAIENAASTAATMVSGIAEPSPDRRLASRMPVSWSRMPATRNSVPL